MIRYFEGMEIVAQLEEWACVNSYSRNSLGLEKMMQLAQKAFSVLEPDELRLLPIGLSLTKRKALPFRIFLGGHLDTVFPKDHPFQKVRYLDEKRLQGPGVADMKGGILVMLHALVEFENSKEAKEIGWEIFLNLDEEIGSPYSTPFLQECSKRCRFALIFEPTLPDGSLVSRRKGSANYLAVSKGKAAHAGRHPSEGKNAIYPLARFIASIEALNEGDRLVNVGMVKGGGPLNIIPDYAEAGVNVRSHDDLESLLRKKADQAGITLKQLSYRPPKPFDEKTEALFNLLKECGKELAMPIDWKETGGVCDGNTFGAAGIPTIDTLGVEGGGMHTENEFVYLPSLKKKIELTASLLKKLSRKSPLWPTA
ncbi:MAG: hydrolase [Chlamydiales bacterium]|nr:hydrolase [Chlamydiales bacterium]